VPGPYDDSLKKLISANPQDFISLVLDGGNFEEILDHELKSVHIYADALLKAVQNGKPMLVHIEFQSGNDPKMQERLLEYNTLASREHDYLPVCSCVIYLKRDGDIPQSPFIRELPDGREVIRFHYRSIELYTIAADELLDTGLVGLLPLLPLTKDGARHEVVEKMITSLVSAERTGLLWFGYALASKVFKADLNWLRRRFAVFNDILRETPVYQEVFEEGVEKGLEKGRLQGREEALQEALQQELQRQRQTLLDIVLERFPKIARLASKLIEAIDDPAILLGLIVKMSTVQTAEEAKQLLFNVAGDEEN